MVIKAFTKQLKTILLVTYPIKKGDVNRMQKIKIFENDTIKVTATDSSRRYFGDFHVVSLEIECEMAILPLHFSSASVYEEITSVVGEKISLFRNLRQMGVPSARVDLVKGELIDNFTRNSIPYFMTTTFPAKALLSEIRKSKKYSSISPATLKDLCAR